MAESRRSPKHTPAPSEADEEAQTRRDRRTLLIFFVGGVIIVIGMFLLSQFLSGR